MTHPVLIFPHIPKTGGTTLLYHFREHMGEDAILKSGPNSRMRLFFDDKPQNEEADAEAQGKMRLIQGHGVTEASVQYAGDRDVRLMIVLRHPVSLTRSRFNQRQNAMKRRADTMTSEQFLKRLGSNFMTGLLVKKFAAFADADAQTDLDRALSILKKFDYVFTMESLDASVVGLMDRLELPTSMERRRVAEAKVPLEADDDRLRALNADDLALYEAASQPVTTQDGRHNGLGFDAEGQARALEAIRARASGDKEQLRIEAYTELARIIAADLRAEAAFAKLDAGGPVALDKPELFRAILQDAWDVKKIKSTPEALEISAHRAKRLAKRLARFASDKGGSAA